MKAPQLGDRVREIVTGNEGIVTGTSEYLWGCRQHLLHYRDKDDKPQVEWYDVGRLQVLEVDVVQAIDYLTSEDTAEPERAHRGAETPPEVRS
jgi:hypothetical protein